MIPPDDENQELLIHRMASLIAMFFCFLIVVGFLIAVETSSWPSLYEFHITVPTRGLDETIPVPTEIPPIQIAGNGTVSFGTLQLPESDRALDSLVKRLREIAPFTSTDNTLPIQPDSDTTNQRIIDLLSAILRSGIRDYHLL